MAKSFNGNSTNSASCRNKIRKKTHEEKKEYTLHNLDLNSAIN